MSFLEEIQKEAVDPNSDLGALLRKCKLLAARLGSQPLQEWLIWESNGYPNNIGVPVYRIWQLKIKGHFSGSFGSGMRNVEIPIALLPQEIRERYYRYECRQSIGGMEQLLKGAETNILTVSTGDLALALSTNVFENQTCIQAWAEFGKAHIYELFNSVRNRILDFSIAIWNENPTAGDTTKSPGISIEPSLVTQIFNTTVYGGSVNLFGNTDHASVKTNVFQGDTISLEKALQEINVQKKDIDSLKKAIREDKLPEEKSKFGPKVSNWISRMIKKAAEGSWAVTVSVAGKILYEIISNYYGW